MQSSKNRGQGVSSDDVVPVKEGESVALNTDVTKQHDVVLWYFNDILIALINEDPSKSCLYDGEGGRFKDRLKVDYLTRSLNITDIRPEHTGRYEVQRIRSSDISQRLNINSMCDCTKIIRKISSITDDIIKTFNMTVSAVPGSGLSSAAVAGICVGVVVVVMVSAAAGVRYYRHKRSSEDTTNGDV